MSRSYLFATRALGTLMLLAGLAMGGTAVAQGGGPLAVGVIVGVAFAVAGGGRLWLARGGGP